MLRGVVPQLTGSYKLLGRTRPLNYNDYESNPLYSWYISVHDNC